MKIRVSREKIRKGLRDSADSCPIACALRSALKTDAVEVNKYNAKVGRVKFPLSTEAKKFIYDFDQGRKVLPFDLEI